MIDVLEAPHPARVLIVDDERHNRQLLEVMLIPEGLVLQTASSGEEALAMVAQQPPDLILLDIMMPGMDGYQTAANIKGNVATKNIPVIMVTALDDRDARVRGLSAGAEDFLTKPVDRAELCVRVRNLLRFKSSLEQVRKDQMRFKDEFLSHVSHELRSPLTAIKQFTTILMSGVAGELNKEQREYQQIVLKNIGQLQAMIDDLLEITRLETGKLTVEPESAAIADAVTDSFHTLQGAAKTKGVTLTCELPAELPSAFADQTRLRQVLIILLDNAIKFTPRGGAVTVRAQVSPDDSRLLLLEVSDTGCGINPEIIERIFERLYQVAKPVETSRKGLGLGLYICKELVTRQGGTIWVTPRSHGATISFTLPVFSLNDTLAPLIKHDTWPAESMALVTVETTTRGAWPSRVVRDEWTQEARGTLQRCLLPDLDVLLPSTSQGGESDRLYVAAFADDRGASVLANRIRGQFARLEHLQRAGLTVWVSYRMLEPFPPNAGTDTESIVTGMARHIDAAIAASHQQTAVTHE